MVGLWSIIGNNLYLRSLNTFNFAQVHVIYQQIGVFLVATVTTVATMGLR